MQIENDYDKDVCNGHIGFVHAIDNDLGDVTVEFDGRPVLYTAITRGRKLVVLVGQKKALAMAVRGSRLVRRWSRLGEWLAGPVTIARV
jgi:exodeoxyribonuclease V alpha subunit